MICVLFTVTIVTRGIKQVLKLQSAIFFVCVQHLQNVYNMQVHHESIFQTMIWLILNHYGTPIISFDIQTIFDWFWLEPMRSSPLPA